MTYEQAAALITEFAKIETKITQKAGASKREAARERRLVRDLLMGLVGSASDDQVNSVIREIS